LHCRLRANCAGQNKHFVGAIDYALRRVNADLLTSTWTGGGSETAAAAGNCQLEYRTYDNHADTLESLRAMTRLYDDGALAFIGPEDTCATEARLAAAWNLPMIAYVSQSITILSNQFSSVRKFDVVGAFLYSTTVTSAPDA